MKVYENAMLKNMCQEFLFFKGPLTQGRDINITRARNTKKENKKGFPKKVSVKNQRAEKIKF